MRIGLAVQEGTYFRQRGGSLSGQLTAPFRGAYNLLSRSVASMRGGSEQGFGGTLSSAWAGHTLLHSSGGNGSISTGFSPDGGVNSARIGLGPHGALGGASQAVGAVVGGAIGYAAAPFLGTGRARSATVGAIVGSQVGAPEVPGAFHNETGIQHDPRAIAHTEQVGPGVHAQFQSLQRDLMETPRGHGTYSFRPDLVRAQNCGSAATRELGDFLQTTTRHNTVMGQLQGVFAQAGGPGATVAAMRAAIAAGPAPVLSPNQVMENAGLGRLTARNNALRAQIQVDALAGVGNQGHITNIMRGPVVGGGPGATHGQL